MTDAQQIFTLAASAIFLALGALCAFRGAKGNALAVPTALLCVDLFAYNALEAVGNLTAQATWEWIESAAAALAAPLLFHLTLAFIGGRRRRRRELVASYVYFGAVAASSLAPLASPDLSKYPGGDVWALLMLVGIAPTFVWASVLLVRHYRESRNAEERARTQLFIVTVFLGVGGAASDLASIAGAEAVPQVAAGGMLLSAIFLAAIALRVRLVSGALTTLAITAVLIGLVGVVAQFLVFHWLGTMVVGLAIGTVIVTLLILFAARFVWSAYAEVRERTAQLAMLGRASAQLAHDLRNPLAAIRGAAQYLELEIRDEEQREFIELIIDQADRLDRVIGDYRRLGSADPRPEDTDVGALLEKVASGAEISPEAEGVSVVCEAKDAGRWTLDPELVATAVENLVRNAIEALEEHEGGGTVKVRAHRADDALIVEVEDDGPGMDPRTRERAEESFFTTKARGSGLGLAFARRVAEVHHGQLRIRSALGRGTTIELTFGAPR